MTSLKKTVINCIILIFFIDMNIIKQALEINKITQQEFADFIGKDRVSLNISLNKESQKKDVQISLERQLKLLVAEKRGMKFDIQLIPAN